MMKELIQKVYEQTESWLKMKDCAEHGASGGVSGFIYYKDTCQFYDDNWPMIRDLAKDQASQLGSGCVSELLRGFVNSEGLSEALLEHGWRGMVNAEGREVTHFKNIMAWFALEEASRYFVDVWLEDYSEIPEEFKESISKDLELDLKGGW